MKAEDLEIKFEPFELLEGYKFVHKIQGCEHKPDFDTNTIVDKILSVRTKQVDEEVIKQLRNFGEEKGINELILIDESKVLNWVKAVKALEIIKNKQVDTYAVISSKSLEEMNKRFWFPSEEWKLTQEEYDLLKEVLL